MALIVDPGDPYLVLVEAPGPPIGADWPPGAASLARVAGDLGFRVKEGRGHLADNAIFVAGEHKEKKVRFFATWIDGRFSAGRIDEPETVWAEVPAPVEKVQGAGKNRAMKPTGYIDGVRLVATSSPLGVYVGVTELLARLRALESRD